MEQLSGWLEQATEEGRAALNSLRTSTTETNDLSEAFRRAIEECRRLSSIEPAKLTQAIEQEVEKCPRRGACKRIPGWGH